MNSNNSDNSDSSSYSDYSDSDDNIETEVETEVEFTHDNIEPNTGNLTAQEAADLCKIMDPDEYGDVIDEMDSEYIESILNKVARNNDELKPQTTEITTEELAAIIDIQEGRKPTCSPAIIEASFEKIASGSVINLNDENINDDHGILVVKQPWWKIWCCGRRDIDDASEDEYESSDSDYDY